MKVRFYIDPATDQPHIYGHSVVEEEVEDVFVITAYELGEKARKALGRRQRSAQRKKP